MSEVDEPSYYEIALTSRQVMVAFVVLLGCMVAAFFSGVWVARVGTAEAAGTQVARSGEEGAGAGDGAEAPEMEELKFFSEQEGEAGSEEAAAEPRPARPTLKEELGLGDDTPVVQPVDTRPPPPPTVAESETPANPAVPRRTARDRPAPSSAAEEFYIQVFSSHDQDQARKLLQRLLDSGYAAFIAPMEVGGRTTYRVRVGPFPSRAEADEVAGRLRGGFRVETWVTSQ